MPTKNLFRDDAVLTHTRERAQDLAAETEATFLLFERKFGMTPSISHTENGTVEHNGLVFRRGYETCAARGKMYHMEMWDKSSLPDAEMWHKVASMGDVGEAILLSKAFAEHVASCSAACSDDPLVSVVIATH